MDYIIYKLFLLSFLTLGTGETDYSQCRSISREFRTLKKYDYCLEVYSCKDKPLRAYKCFYDRKKKFSHCSANQETDPRHFYIIKFLKSNVCIKPFLERIKLIQMYLFYD